MTHHRLLSVHIENKSEGAIVRDILNSKACNGLSFTLESTTADECHAIALHVAGYKPHIEDIVRYWDEAAREAKLWHMGVASREIGLDHKRGIE